MPKKNQSGAGGEGKSLLTQLTEVIGADLALKVSSKFGGRELYIAHSPPRDSRLVKVIGEVAARKLAKNFGGITLKIPVGAGRRARIVELLKQGKTKGEVAETLVCTERAVYLVKADYEKEFGAIVPRPRGRRGGEKEKPPRGLAAQEIAGQTNLFTRVRRGR